MTSVISIPQLAWQLLLVIDIQASDDVIQLEAALGIWAA
jgi:hypothetical protein